MKMKLMLFVCLLGCFSLSALAQKIAPDAKMGEVVIKGRIGNINDPMQLWIHIGDGPTTLVPIKYGSFEHRIKTKLPAYGYIRVNYVPYIAGKGGGAFSNMSMASVFFEEGTMVISSKSDSFNTRTLPIKGSKLQDRYLAYWKKEGNITREQKILAEALNKATPEQLQSEAFIKEFERKNEVVLQKWDKLIEKEIKKYPNSFHTRFAYSGYRRLRQPDEQTSKRIESLLPAAYRPVRQPAVKDSSKKAPPIEIKQGELAPQFTQNDLKGKPLKLSDLKGKYVLIDFWASWCKPCREVNPDLVRLYQKNKDQNFEILGVSLDIEKSKWEDAIGLDRLNWLHVSDLRGWMNEVALQYGVHSIPQNFLIGPDGKVIHKDLRIGELDTVLNGLLNTALVTTPAENSKAETVEVGDVPALSLPDLYKREFNLSSLKGKYVLLDFWASWCKPCRDEHPRLVRLFNHYKGQNFELVSISIDTEYTSWYNAVKKDGLVWTNLSDLAAGNGKASPYVNIEVEGIKASSVPQNYLLDPSGKVIAKNVRGQALDELLEKTLQN